MRQVRAEATRRPTMNRRSGAQQRVPGALLKRLAQSRVGRLATLDADGRPHVVPVCFVYFGNAFYTALDQKPKRVSPERLVRVKNIRARPRVALLIDEYREDWSRLWYVLIRATAQLVPTSAHEERARALRKLRAKYQQYGPGMLPDDAPIIRIRPERATSWGRI
jgi:coenzyme F420-0:L-glutamate ligase / coenzyme F420-1:gamma-L-glutamate ligase